jgi:hypothetical protein
MKILEVPEELANWKTSKAARILPAGVQLDH